MLVLKTSKRGQPLYKGQNSCAQLVRYSEVLLYMVKYTKVHIELKSTARDSTATPLRASQQDPLSSAQAANVDNIDNSSISASVGPKPPPTSQHRPESPSDSPSPSKASNAPDLENHDHVTKYLRKVEKSLKIDDIYKKIKKISRSGIKDIKVSQVLEDSEFKGKWKFLALTTNSK